MAEGRGFAPPDAYFDWRPKWLALILWGKLPFPEGRLYLILLENFIPRP